MSTTVTGKLNKAPHSQPTNSGDTLFRVNIGKKERNRQTNEDVWVNYSAALFAKQGAQANFYNDVLQEGAIVSVSGTGILPRIWGDNNDKVGLDIVDAKMIFANNPNQQSTPNHPQAPQQQGYQNQPNPTYQQAAPQQQQPINNMANTAQPTVDDFDSDSIPF